MDRKGAIAALSSLGLDNPTAAVSQIEEGTTSLLRTSNGIQIALLRRHDKFDTLILGTEPDCPVPSLRAVLETAVLPFSDTYAATIGVAIPERDAVRKRICEASVALDVIAKGRYFSVPPAEIIFNPTVRNYVQNAQPGVKLPDDFYQDLRLLNQLHASVVAWNKEIDRIVQCAKTGPDAVLSVEEETVFWSSLDSALASAQTKLASEEVRVTLDVLARNRRATGFLQDVSHEIDTARRKAAAVLMLVQGLPIVALRTADDLCALQEGVKGLLAHVAGKLRVSAISIERVLSLVDSLGGDVSRSIGRILSRKGGMLTIQHEAFVAIFEDCCDLFESWSLGFDHCRKVAREAARKRGETMPPRQKSPLSHLHSHLRDVYDLRSNHEALRSVFSDMTVDAPFAKTTIDHLDSSYASLVKEAESFEHFDLRATLGSAWAQVSHPYRMQLAKAEASASSSYQNIIQNESSFSTLSKSLLPFRGIVDKHFMSSVVEDAVPLVLSLGRRDLVSLRNREAFVKKGSFVNRSGDVPSISIALSEYQMLQRRSKALVKFVQDCVGETQMKVTPDLREFVVDIERLQGRTDPSIYLTEWLDKINLSLFNSSFFNLIESGDGAKSLGMTINPAEALFFRVIHMFRDDYELGAIFSSKHLELSRSCRSHYPSYCNLRDAVFCFNTFYQRLFDLDELKASSVWRFFSSRISEIQGLVEEGVQMRWADSSSKLLSFSSQLCKECSALLRDLHFVLERDMELEEAVQVLKDLNPCFVKGKIADDTISEVESSIGSFLQAVESLQIPSLDTEDIKSYISIQWIPVFNKGLLGVLGRLSQGWVSALNSNNLGLPIVVFDVVHRNSSNASVCCLPSIWDVEQLLYKSVGDAYSTFLETVRNCFSEAKVDMGMKTLISPEALMSAFLAKQEVMETDGVGLYPFSAIRSAIELLSKKVNQWCIYARYRNIDLLGFVSESGNIVEGLGDALEVLTTTYENVLQLMREHNQTGGGQNFIDCGLLVDVSELGQGILNTILELLSRVCDKGSLKAAETSQQVYERISNAKSTIQDAFGVDSSEMLVSLQTVKDNILPVCDGSVKTLTDLENKFSEISERVGDSSLSRAQHSETWILSEELVANLKSLRELLEHRMRNLLVNREMLQKRYQERERAYQDDLAAVFSEFQRIRSDDNCTESFLESAPALGALEEKLGMLGDERLGLERVGKALGMPSTLDTKGPENILAELRKVQGGIQQLSSLENTISVMSQARFKDVNPRTIREKLMRWVEQVDDIARVSGAKGEANLLRGKISNLLKMNNLLSGLHAAKMSPQRERDVIRHLFGSSYQGGGIGEMTLGMFWATKLLEHAKYLREVFENAAGENSISEYLGNIERTWLCRKCTLMFQGGVAVMKGIPGLLDELDEHMQGLEAMRGSSHARLFESDRAGWEQRLSNCRENLDLFSDVQSRWSHLRSLFGVSSTSVTSSLRTELQEEFVMFSNVHARFSSLGKRIQAAPGLLEVLDSPSGLDDMSKELASVVRGLSAYLEKQRTQFPRFFFLSDTDLLHVLSVSSDNVDGVVPLVGKIFPGLSSVTFENEDGINSVINVISKEGEQIVFETPVLLSRNEAVSSWLSRIQDEITRTLKSSLRPAVLLFSTWYEGHSGQTLKEGSEKGVTPSYRTEFPAQIALLAMKTCFTEAVERCISERDESGERLRLLLITVENILSQQRSSMTGKASEEIRKHVLVRDQFIKELLYQRELLCRFLKLKVVRLSSYHWTHELRFYCSNEKGGSHPDITICCGQASFSYGWEYLGVGETLVQTKLTSRCFLTLSEALRRGLGGSPFGPAGTGKTETVKALGRHMGRFVAVFNCDESFDSVSVGRILAGACRVGCWVCFDEFNRLSASILSSTSGQLATLQSSIRKGDTKVNNFYGGDLPISIRPGVGVFITMNPTYSGRRELPANLKSLFRPCAMSKPDFLVIAEVMFLSQGFKTSAKLSKKLLSLFYNLKSVLSSRPHYDFGLRTLKSTISASGSLLATESHSTGSSVDSFEEDIVICALADVVKPKLVDADVKVYDNSVCVVFTNASLLSSKLPSFVEDAVREILLERGLLCEASFLEKVTQLYSILQHQSGIMLVGPTSSGKTAVWKTLYGALRRICAEKNSQKSETPQIRPSLTVLDPKLLTTKQLYGFLDSTTREWSDGLFTKVLRNLWIASSEGGQSDGHAMHWIVFDGDVDPDWAENLNSVLDDNKILTLPSGEQIPLPKSVRILFETDSLRHANPSTISRCGMVCFGCSLPCAEVFSKSLKAVLNDLYPSFSWPSCMGDMITIMLQLAQDVVENGKAVMHVPLQSITDSILRMIRTSLSKFTRLSDSEGIEDLSSGTNFSDNGSLANFSFIRLFVVSSIKGITAGLLREDQCKVTQQLMTNLGNLENVRECFSGVNDYENYAEVAVMPDGILKEFLEFVPTHSDIIRSEDVASPDIVIPTPTTLRLESLFRETLDLEATDWPRAYPLILCGPPGCGKSMLLSAALRDIPNVSLATLSFSSETCPENVMAALRGHTMLSKRANGTLCLRPKAVGCRVVLFCDEVNLENPDQYGTQQTIAFLRSIAEQQGYWHGTPSTWVSVEGIQIVAACNPAEDAGRHKLPPRFLKLCTVVRVEQPNERDLQVIYQVFVDSLLRSIHGGLGAKMESLTAAMVEFFILNKKRFCPVRGGPIEPHYVYSPRDLSRWVRGMQKLLAADRSSTFENGLQVEDESDTFWAGVISAFCYEARRIFSDRLMRQEERIFVEDILKSVVHKHLDPEGAPLSDSFYTSWLADDEEDKKQSKYFSLVYDPERFRTLIYQKLRIFSEEEGLGGSWMGAGNGSSGFDDSQTMIDQFAVTDDVLTHLTRLERILSQPLGHAVLMGAPGTGKKTLARFAAWMLSIEVHQVYSHSSYSEVDFANDLRLLLKKAGVNGLQVMMIFDESNALDSAFLEMMNSILACGDVPGLFSGDERMNLLEELRQRGSSNGSTTDNEQAMYSDFVKRVRQNLHVVFTLSTGCSSDSNSAKEGSKGSGGDISKRSPALYNRCTVDWIGDWSKQTLEAVAELKIEVSLGREKDQIIQSAVRMYEVAQSHISRAGISPGVTPRHYLEFVEQLNRIALEKGNAIQGGVDRHTEGLRRLKSAGDAVDILKGELSVKTERLQLKEKHAGETLGKMVEEQRLAEKSKVAAEQLAAAARDASLKTQEREDEVAIQLAEVQPKIEAAREAVGLIRKEYLEELRAMPNPPSGVRIALDGVMMVLSAGSGNRKSEMQFSWGNIRSRMRGGDFIASVVNFDAQSLQRGSRSRIEKKILHNPDFDVERISYASRAAGPLAEWTISVLEYAAVKDAVEPLQEEICVLQQEQQELLQRQDDALQEVDELQERIQTCRTQYAALVSEAERVRQEIKDAESNLQRSEDMLDSLSEEWNRWVKELNVFNASAVTVWGNAVCGAAFIAYAGPVDYDVRSCMFEDWRDVLRTEGIPFEENLKPCEFLTSPQDRALWSTLGLPTDTTSLENYAILKRSARFPLIIDPNRGSTSLLRKVLVQQYDSIDGGNGDRSQLVEPRISESSFTATGKKSYMRALESALRFGTIIVLEDAEKFDRAVAPLLGQESSYGDLSQEGLAASLSPGSEALVPRNERRDKNVSQRVVRLGDRDVFLNSSFRMFLGTADISAVPAAAISRSNVVSFELSSAALKSTCANRAMKILCPQLEERRKSSLAAKLKFAQRKRCLEEDVLAAITNVEDLGTELLKGPLLDILVSLKKEVELLESRQSQELEASREIAVVESTFQVLGETAVDVFDVLRSLSDMHPLYSFHVPFFLSLFDTAIKSCKGKEAKQGLEEVRECQASIIRYSYCVVESSLFPRDRLPFAAALSLISLCHLSVEGNKQAQCEDLAKLHACLKRLLHSHSHALPRSEKDSGESWENLPQGLQSKLSTLRSNKGQSLESTLDKLLHLVLCAVNIPHQLRDAVDKLACAIPGSDDVIHGKQTGSVASLSVILEGFGNAQVCEVSGNTYSPLLLCARGDNWDAAALVIEKGAELDLSVISVAMGNTQTEAWMTDSISQAIRQSGKRRRVVLLLKNAHFATKPTLERLQSEVLKRNGKLPFLLVISIEVTARYSGSFLTSIVPFCRLLAFEAQPSFRANFSSSIDKVSALCNQNPARKSGQTLECHKLNVVSSWLHACVLERAMHFPTGFSRKYQFSEGDLVAAWDFSSLAVSRSDNFEESVDDVANMLTSCVYGCRIEDSTDLDIVRAVVFALCSSSILISEEKEHVKVFSDKNMSCEVVVPLQERERSLYIRSLPLQAPPLWSSMPSDTTRQREVAEGKAALDSVLKLSQRKFKKVRERTSSSSAEVASGGYVRNTEELKECERILSALGNIQLKMSGSDLLDVYIERESSALQLVVNSVRQDIRSVLGMDESASLTRSPRTRKLEMQFLREGKSLGSVPNEWKKLCKSFPALLSVREFVCNLGETVNELRELAGDSKNRIKLSNVLRPGALLESLKFTEAKYRQVLPHNVRPEVTGESGKSESCRGLAGVELRGGKWIADEKVFMAQGEAKEEGLYLNWVVVEDEEDEEMEGYVELPWYGSGAQRNSLGMVRIPVKETSSEKWRLCGACLWVV